MMAFDKLLLFLFSIDHELQFVYARIDFTEMCDAGRNQHQQEHWFSSEHAGERAKANRMPYRKEHRGLSHKLWNRITVLVRACLVCRATLHTHTDTSSSTTSESHTIMCASKDYKLCLKLFICFSVTERRNNRQQQQLKQKNGERAEFAGGWERRFSFSVSSPNNDPVAHKTMVICLLISMYTLNCGCVFHFDDCAFICTLCQLME